MEKRKTREDSMLSLSAVAWGMQWLAEAMLDVEDKRFGPAYIIHILGERAQEELAFLENLTAAEDRARKKNLHAKQKAKANSPEIIQL